MRPYNLLLLLFFCVAINTPSSFAAAPQAHTTAPTVAAPYDATPAPMAAPAPIQEQGQAKGQGQNPTAMPQSSPKQNSQEATALAEKVAEEARKKVQEEAAKAFKDKAYAKAQRLWLALAGQNDAEAMLGLGLLFEEGLGTKVNHKEALGWYRQAADAGQLEAMYRLGRMLKEGRGTSAHADTAAVWFRRAAEGGHAAAQYALGLLYQEGKGLVQNTSEAAAWFSRAAAQNHVEALAMLGHLYAKGQGVSQNIPRATLLLYGAAMRGHEGATKELLTLAKEKYNNNLPRVTLFGTELSAEKGIQRAPMRSSLSLAGLKIQREDQNYICDVYDLQNSVPGATHMAACYNPNAPKVAQQELGFLKIDYPVKDAAAAKSIQNMVEQRFGSPSAGENNTGFLWNLGHVIVATQYVPEAKQVGLMYILPRVYHQTVMPKD